MNDVSTHARAESIRRRLLAGLPVTDRRLRLNGVSTAVLEGGEGSPVVLLHGPGEYAAKWLRVIAGLAETHRIIVPDLPGHGASEEVDGPLDEARVLGWLDELIEITCPSPPVLIGQIVGGAIAARYAIARSDRLRRLVLVDALGLAPFSPEPEFGLALSEYVEEPNETTHDRLWSLCAHDLDRLRSDLGDRWEWIKAYNLDRARAPDLRLAQRELMGRFGMPAIPAEDLARITVPTMLIWGRHDLATPLSVAQQASSRHGWPLHVIDNAGDDPPIEQPEAFLRALRSGIGEAAGNRPPTPDAREAWDRIAPAYDRFVTRAHRSLGAEGLRRAGLVAGMSFLDVAAGSGALSIPAARMGAQVLATDLSPVMLELLAAGAREEGLDIATRVMDGQALTLEDDRFDMAGSQFGVMLFPDMPRGIREMARVVRPGGRVLVHAFGDPRKIEFLAFLTRAVQSVRPDFRGLPQDPPPLPLQLCDPQRVRREFEAAGLTDVRVEATTETLEFASGQAIWDWLLSSNPIVRSTLDSLRVTQEEHGPIQRALERMIRERAGSAEVARLTVPINIGIGTR